MIVSTVRCLVAAGVAVTVLAGCSSDRVPTPPPTSAAPAVVHRPDASAAAGPGGARTLPDDVDALFPPASSVGTGFATRGPLPEDVRPVPYENAAYENPRTREVLFLTLSFYVDASHARAAVARAAGTSRLSGTGPLAAVGDGGAVLQPRKVPVGTRRDAVLSQGRVFATIVTVGPDHGALPVRSVVRFAELEVNRLRSHGY